MARGDRVRGGPAVPAGGPLGAAASRRRYSAAASPMLPGLWPQSAVLAAGPRCYILHQSFVLWEVSRETTDTYEYSDTLTAKLTLVSCLSGLAVLPFLPKTV